MCLCHSHVHCSGADGNEAFAEAKITFLWSRFHVELDDERAGQQLHTVPKASADASSRAVPKAAGAGTSAPAAAPAAQGTRPTER